MACFTERVGGHIVTSNVDYTCNAGAKGSHVDFAMCSASALCFARSVEAELAAPQKTHIGLRIRLRDRGQQLPTRALPIAPRPPQAQRPEQEPHATSKYNRSRASRLLAAQTAAAKREEVYSALSVGRPGGHRSSEDQGSPERGPSSLSPSALRPLLPNLCALTRFAMTPLSVPRKIRGQMSW
eukprot:1579993-Pyramimonas_sp.AAC.1